MLDLRCLGKDILVGDHSCQFQITVVDRSMGVLECHESSYDRWRKPRPPQQWSHSRNKPHAAHAEATCINGTDPGGHVRNDFFQSSGPLVQVACQPGEVIELVTDRGINADTVGGIALLEPSLHGAEQSSSARNGGGHAAQLAQDFVPVTGRYAFLATEFFENGGDAFGPVLWELQSLFDCVDDPSKDCFSGFPFSITFPQFLQRKRLLLSVGVFRTEGLEDLVERVQKYAGGVAFLGLAALQRSNKIIDINVEILQGL